jgi:N-formylglutamate amidohydrolase
VLASPHSGTEYSAEFLAASRLDPMALRRSEDSFVNELFGAAPRLGAPLLSARFPRAYVDANREAYELDPSMFTDALPKFVNAQSPRVRMGLGTIARIVASGEEIYAKKLCLQAQRRIEQLTSHYHERCAAHLRDEACSAAVAASIVIPHLQGGFPLRKGPTSSLATATVCTCPGSSGGRAF